MAILKSPPKPPKNETIQIRVEETIRSKLSKYAEFIDSSESYVVSQALKLLFRKDDGFKTWLEYQNHNGCELHNDGGSLFEIFLDVHLRVIAYEIDGSRETRFPLSVLGNISAVDALEEFLKTNFKLIFC